ncbi:beta-galactosidase [Cellulosimicrobium cellulans]|uniref:beta-galactosidase n=1 Tax=Cellulosimicrobium cellulans TaxID=1710 RepID=UPI00130DB241|nr:beta-galactosidase [Cellulosimicrobium cellulans]
MAPVRFPSLTDDLVLAGEVHYFRLDRSDWADRLDDALDLGLTAVATYVPWLVHETVDGGVDVTGRTRPELDVGAFLDLCADRGLAVIARPGPFVMAELKHEGLGQRLLREHPEVVPPGWDGAVPDATVVDYLHPAYLAACGDWLDAVLPVLARRTVDRGGPVVAVQLDNEVGMLPWVTNSPDLSGATVADLGRRLSAEAGAGGPEALRARYGADPRDPAAWAAAVRSPAEGAVLALRGDLGRQARDRYAEYVGLLRDRVRAAGIDVPLLVNVHGCWGGEARHFPLGVAQLHRTWAGRPDVLPGADYYLGDLTLAKLPGLWASNAFLAATVAPGQPTGTLEFEVGTGDYGEALDVACGPEAAPLKLQLCVAQGQTFVNYYLLTGGRNPLLPAPVGDGNDRVASTGERHGFAAPVDPEGRRSPGWDALRGATRAVTDAAALLRGARPEPAPVTLGFVPDHYMTEYRYPGSAREAAHVADLERSRGSGPREVLTRALVLGGFAPDAVDLQADGCSGARTLAGLPAGRVLALGSTPVLDPGVQARLADWVRAGGRLLLHGPVPTLDPVGQPCTVLLDALGVAAGARVESSATRFPSVTPADDRLPLAEVRAGFVQPLTGLPAGADVLARVTGSGAPCVVRVPCGAGEALLVAADLPCALPAWAALLAALGAEPVVAATSTAPVVVVPTAAPDGTRVVHVLNVSPWPAEVSLARGGVPLAGPGAGSGPGGVPGVLALPARSGAWLVQPPGADTATLGYAGAEGAARWA